MKPARIAWVVVLVLLVGFSVWRYVQPPAFDVLTGETMGTTWTVKARNADPEAIQATLDAVDRRMSTYKSDSELSVFNAAQTTEPVTVSPRLLTVVRAAESVSAASDGAFDITVGPAVRAWGFGGGRTAAEPPELEPLKRRVGYQKLHIEGGALRKEIPDLSLDLSAIAKGYAVDEVVRTLEDAGVEDYMVEVGGEVRARGRRWRIGIENPDPATRGEVYAVVELDGHALATSGSYRNFYERDGKRISHTIDPRTVSPIEHNLVSVSVITDSAVMADAWATAIHVMGPDAGHQLALQQRLAVLLIVEEEGKLTERSTPHLEEFRIE